MSNISRTMLILYRLLERISLWLDRVSISAGIIMLFLMLALTFMSVILRYGFDISYAWYEHVIILMLVWSIFILVGSSTRRDDHITVGFFIEKIAGSEERARRIRTVLDTVIGLGISTFLVWALYRWAAYSHGLGSQIYITGTGYYAEWIRRVPVVVGIGLVSFFYLERFIKLLVLLIEPERKLAVGREIERDGENQNDWEVSGLPHESIKGDGKES